VPAPKKAPRGAPVPAPARRDGLVSRPLELDFPAHLVDKPILYELVKRFDLVPNIKRANITQEFGYIQLELKGKAAAMESALAYLKKVGVSVAPIEKDVVES
jgi:ABC-type methionine transport system ATPase subunit